MIPLVVIACGGRDLLDNALVRDGLDAVVRALGREPAEVILRHGACGWEADDERTWTPSRLRGADYWADVWALSRPVAALERVAAAWRREGPSAGPRRNTRMLAAGADVVVAFPGGAGTADMVRQATAAGVRVCRVRRGARALMQLEWSTPPDPVAPRQGSLFGGGA